MRHPFKTALIAVVVTALAGIGASSAEEARGARVGRTLATSVEAPEPSAVRVPEGAPNIVWILLDDVGFGATSAFGGPVPTPTFDALANGGLRFTNFHTTGVCSPTRAALMTGRNHNTVGMGLFPHEILSAEFPGYHGRLQPQDGTIAEYLRANGYSTYALGKWHLTPDAEATNLGPFDRWPSGKGFDHFFGFLGGAEDQYTPRLAEDNRIVQPDGRHLNAQLIDRAISYVDDQRELAPERPFFLYLAPGAGHSPHQVEQEWLDRFRGRYDAGWDVFRQEIFERQRQQGLIPADAVLPERDERVPAWDSLSADQKRVYARFMEGYAAFLAYTDWEIGRFVEHLRETNQLENTAFFVIIGDNGSSKEGGNNGSILPELRPRTSDDAGQLAELLTRIDDIGTRRSYSNYPIGWAQALNTPFREWKADPNSEGGTRNPLIVHWPRGLQQTGIRTQYGHVIDLLPTALEIIGEEQPATIRGIAQTSVQGTSLFYSFNNPNAPNRHTQQYYALFGSGAIVRDGWKASFAYRPDYQDLFSTYPAPTEPPNAEGEVVWELYDLNADFNERVNVAAQHPDRLRRLQAEFERQARANNVYPLINWSDIYVRARAIMAQGQAARPAIVPEGDGYAPQASE